VNERGQCPPPPPPPQVEVKKSKFGSPEGDGMIRVTNAQWFIDDWTGVCALGEFLLYYRGDHRLE